MAIPMEIQATITDDLIAKLVALGTTVTVWDDKIPSFCVEINDDEITFSFEKRIYDIDSNDAGSELVLLNPQDDEDDDEFIEITADEARVEAAKLALSIASESMRVKKYPMVYGPDADEDEQETVIRHIAEVLKEDPISKVINSIKE